MIVLIIGIVIFLGVHLIPLTDLRNSLIASMGEKKYQGLFALISLVGLVIIIYGFRQIDDCNPMMADCDTDNIFLWEPFAYSREISFLLMPFSIIFIAASLVQSNLTRILRHPMLIGVLIWSFCHLLSNGDLRSIILFASLGVYSIIDIIYTRKAAPPAISFPASKDAMVIASGLIAYSVLLYFHQYVSGEQIVEKNNLFFFLP